MSAPQPAGTPPTLATVPRSWIAAAAVTIHVCLGSVYAWSIFIPALQKETGWSKPALTWAFSLAIACLGLTAAFAAPLVRKWGPSLTVRGSALAFGVGLVGAGAAIHLRSLPMLYLFYGVVGGIGLGLGYVPPVTTLMRWFEDRKGFATGLAVGGFGLGALLASYLGAWLLQHVSCGPAFAILGAAYGTVILLAAKLLRLPQGAASAAPSSDPASLVLRKPAFWLLWFIFFLNIATGILLIALARPLLEDAAKGLVPLVPIVTAVALMGLFNGLGRLGWASLSDRWGRMRVWGMLFLCQGVAFLLLRWTVSPFLLTSGLWLIASCYGGGFALCPALVADLFGAAKAPRVYGLALLAWSAAALVSPPLAAWMREISGSYRSIMGACVVASLMGFLLVRALARWGHSHHEVLRRP